MKVILDMVISPNGMIAREDGDEDWLPSEGWDEFVAQATRHGNIVMGRETYEQVTARYKDYNFEAVDVPHKVIVTTRKDFTAPTGYIIVHSPEEALAYIKKTGADALYLIGGGVLNAEFIKRKLVTHLQLTVTPYIIGKGRPFLAPDDYELSLTLVETKRLSIGRVKLSYKVNM
jgi:dihydrofolate reductase